MFHAPRRAAIAVAMVAALGISAPAPAVAARPAALPKATTFTSLTGLPLDSDKFGKLSGLVVHPKRAVGVYPAPGGKAVAVLPATQLGGPTWVPVVESRSGWVRVLLPSKPNYATGWIRSKGLQRASSHFRVVVDLSDKKLAVVSYTKKGKKVRAKKVGTWTVAVGSPESPTPVGRTFLLALMAPKEKKYSPFILPLGTHSQTLDSFGGGPGTVAFHGWPDPKVFGKAVTHGCVRVPPSALKVLVKLPLGTPVLIAD
ncbi:L,D-transpeptidase [Nonomuraea sp. NPDC050556]|uniref:L,D-transpeptidase n=1 Tax=Nonomuraea sp. NPDC050556 TaxID=3364369 RepID=UPI0037A5B37C